MLPYMLAHLTPMVTIFARNLHKPALTMRLNATHYSDTIVAPLIILL